MIGAICYILYCFIFPALLFYCYGRCSFTKLKWRWYLPYMLFFFGIITLEQTKNFPGIIPLFLKVLLLTICGIFLLKQNITKAVSISALILSIFYLTTGMMQSVSYWILGNLSNLHMIVLKYMDILQYLSGIILFFLTFSLSFKLFLSNIKNWGYSVLLLLDIPLLFIALAEQTVSASIYGDTVIWDTDTGLVFPVVNNVELILLHIFAYIGMCSILLVFQKLIKSMQKEQSIKLLEIQTKEQETYIQEAQARYEQTRSFRHDIKNHFIVLRELLSNEESAKANEYLSALDTIADSLSCPVSTKNMAVDVLLGNKILIANQNEIQTECNMEIPANCEIKDIDWCILLANAMDNAIEASKSTDASKKYIHIHSKRKGSLFLLHVENNCKKNMKIPAYGIGLSNISTVVEKYHGTMDIDVGDGIFQLDILLFISHQ